jgi:hypothetical protein
MVLWIDPELDTADGEQSMTTSDDDIWRRIEELLTDAADARINRQGALNATGDRVVDAIVAAAETDIEHAGGEEGQ